MKLFVRLVAQRKGMVINMKKIIITLLAFSMLIMITSASTSAVALEENKQQTIISFVEDTTAEDIDGFINQHNLVVNEIRTTSVVGSNVYTTGYVSSDTTDISKTKDRFSERYYKMLRESLEAYSNNPYMHGQFLSRMNDYLEYGLQVTAIVVENNTQTRGIQFDGDKIVQDIQIISLSGNNSPHIENAGNTRALNWLPTSGSGAVWNSAQLNNAVYMNLNWKWDSPADLSFFTNAANATLESEIVFHNYNGEGHAVGWYSGDWSYDTNQPAPYQDTDFNFGNVKEVPYTIGCSDATRFTAGKNYYWSLYGEMNHSEGSMAKIYFQRGHKVFNIPNTWFIVADETIVKVKFSDWDTGSNNGIYF